MKRNRGKRRPLLPGLVPFLVLLLALTPSTPAFAIFGEEDWLSGQNALLSEMLAAQLEELTEITTLIANVRTVVQSTNEALALAREVKRVYDMIRNYSLEDLEKDAKIGLHRAIPELQATEREIGILIENGQAIEQGSGAFFSKVTVHDTAVSKAARRTFEHGYQSAIWPQVFPNAMDYLPDPSPVELMVQERYRRTADQRRQAVQRTAMSVLAEKVKAFVEDAEQKENVELRSLSTNTQINLQSMENLTELRNMKEQEVAIEEAARLEERAVKKGLGDALDQNADLLLRPGASGAIR